MKIAVGISGGNTGGWMYPLNFIGYSRTQGFQWWRKLMTTDELIEQARLTPKEQDACTPSKEQLDAYLAEPDDGVAYALRLTISTEDFRQIGRVILYGRNIAEAQLTKFFSIVIKEECPDCHGTKIIVGFIHCSVSENWCGNKRQEYPCPTCKGTGTKEVTVRDTIGGKLDE